jgi:GDSL-like Lipase/Acylhydrolase family
MSSTESISPRIQTALATMAVLILALTGSLGIMHATVDTTSSKWKTAALLLYVVLPVTLYWLGRRRRRDGLKAAALWLGVFLVGQTGISFYTANAYAFRTLPPSFTAVLDVKEEIMPGIHGLQTITTDHLGFRVTRPVNYDAKPGGTLRVFAIGASTTEQIYLDNNKTWCADLERALTQAYGRSVEVINAGVSGLRAGHHLKTAERILAYQPDLIIFLQGINDWNHQVRGALGGPFGALRIPGLSDTLIGSIFQGIKQRWRARAVAGGSDATDAARSEGAWKELFTKRSNTYDKRTRTISWQPASVSGEYESVVARQLAFCETHHVKCLFATQPTVYGETLSERMKQHLWMAPPDESFALDMKSLVGTAATYNTYLSQRIRGGGSAAVCDLAGALGSDERLYYDDCHFNEAGAHQVAETLAGCIRTAALVQ